MTTPLRSSPVLIMWVGAPVGVARIGRRAHSPRGSIECGPDATRGPGRCDQLSGPDRAPSDDDVARELRQRARRGRATASSGRGPRSGRRSRPPGRSRARPRTPSGSGSGSSVPTRPKPRLLVGGEADPVPQPVAVRRPSPIRVDHGPGDRVRLATARRHGARGDRRLDPVDRRLLRPRDEVVDGEVAFGRLADEQRAGHVAAVALDLGAEVEQQHRVARAPADRRASRAGGRPRAPRGRRRRTRAPPRRRCGSATRGAARGRAP